MIFKNFLLRGHISYRCRLTPYSIVRDQSDTVRCPADFTRIFRCNSLFISKFAIIPIKKQVVKIRKIEAEFDSDSDENHTCSRLQKFQ